MQSPINIYLDEFANHISSNPKTNNNLVIYTCQMNAYSKSDVESVKKIGLEKYDKTEIDSMISRMKPKIKYFRRHIAPQRENGRGWRKLAQKVARDLIKISYKHEQNGFDLPQIYPCHNIGDYILENLSNKRNNVIAGEILKKIKRLDRTHKSTDLRLDFYIKEMAGEEAKRNNKEIMKHLSKKIRQEREKIPKIDLPIKDRDVIPMVIEKENRFSLDVKLDMFDDLYVPNPIPQTF